MSELIDMGDGSPKAIILELSKFDVTTPGMGQQEVHFVEMPCCGAMHPPETINIVAHAQWEYCPSCGVKWGGVSTVGRYRNS